MLYAFDLLEHDGDDLRELPLIKRKRRLAKLIGKAKRRAIQFVEHLAGDGPTVFEHVCRMGLEGVVSKRVDAPYRSGPSKVGLAPCGLPLLFPTHITLWQVRWPNGTMRKHRSRQRENRPLQVLLHPVPAVAAFSARSKETATTAAALS